MPQTVHDLNIYSWTVFHPDNKKFIKVDLSGKVKEHLWQVICLAGYIKIAKKLSLRLWTWDLQYLDYIWLLYISINIETVKSKKFWSRRFNKLIEI